MQSARDLLKKMAFNEKAPNSTKEAFLKNLQKALIESTKAEVIPVAAVTKAESTSSAPAKKAPEQLSFDFESVG